MVTEADRDDALASLLIEQVERSAPESAVTSGVRDSSRRSGRRDRWRIGIATGAVLIAVVTVGVLAITVGRTAAPAPAGPTTPVTVPTPGQVLATFSSDDGQRQTRTVAANGAPLELSYRCSGSGDLRVTIARGPSLAPLTCDGPVTTVIPTGIAGSVSVTVTSTAAAGWTLTIQVPDRG